jgi:hypothetical protein
MAVISHDPCEPWLHQCLRSLVQQTRPPDHSVVIHDGDKDRGLSNRKLLHFLMRKMLGDGSLTLAIFLFLK